MLSSNALFKTNSYFHTLRNCFCHNLYYYFCPVSLTQYFHQLYYEYLLLSLSIQYLSVFPLLSLVLLSSPFYYTVLSHSSVYFLISTPIIHSVLLWSFLLLLTLLLHFLFINISFNILFRLCPKLPLLCFISIRITQFLLFLPLFSSLPVQKTASCRVSKHRLSLL